MTARLPKSKSFYRDDRTLGHPCLISYRIPSFN
jgi:hypothetical protein